MCGQEDFWWPSCEHRVEERWHQWQCANRQCLPVMVGQVQGVPHSQRGMGRSSRSCLVPAPLGAFHTSTSNHRKGLTWIFHRNTVKGRLPHLNTSETSNTEFLVAFTFIRQMRHFLLIIFGAVVFWWPASGINLQKPVGLFLRRNYPRSNPCWPNPTAEPIEGRCSLRTTKLSSEQGFRSSKTKSPQPSLYEQHHFIH